MVNQTLFYHFQIVMEDFYLRDTTTLRGIRREQNSKNAIKRT